MHSYRNFLESRRCFFFLPGMKLHHCLQSSYNVDWFIFYVVWSCSKSSIYMHIFGFVNLLNRFGRDDCLFVCLNAIYVLSKIIEGEKAFNQALYLQKNVILADSTELTGSSGESNHNQTIIMSSVQLMILSVNEQKKRRRTYEHQWIFKLWLMLEMSNKS